MPAGMMYNAAILAIVQQNLDVESDEIKLLLVDSSYAFDPDHGSVADVADAELENLSGTGYERKTATNVSIALVAGNKVRVDCDNPTFSAINTTEDAVAVIFYREGANDSESLLICCLEGLSLSTNGSDIEIRISDEGIFEVINQLP